MSETPAVWALTGLLMLSWLFAAVAWHGWRQSLKHHKETLRVWKESTRELLSALAAPKREGGSR